MLDSLIDANCGLKLTTSEGVIQATGQQAMRNLWQSIRQKVFPNYSTKGYRQLIDWVSKRFKQLADV